MLRANSFLRPCWILLHEIPRERWTRRFERQESRDIGAGHAVRRAHIPNTERNDVLMPSGGVTLRRMGSDDFLRTRNIPAIALRAAAVGGAMRLLGTRLLVLAALSAACLIQPAAAQPAAAAPAAKSDAEPIYHETSYPEGNGPFPVIVALHTSSGFKSVQHQIAKYTNAGYAVYAPDFFRRHGLTSSNRFETWTTYRTQIEAELLEIIEIIKRDPKADPRNIFAVGWSNGGYWASFLAARRHVSAGAAHYGVWAFPNHNGYPAGYFDRESNPLLAIHGDNESVQKSKFVYPQLEIAAGKSPMFRKHIFGNVGHSWDCRPCLEDGYDHEATKEALRMTLEFFEANKR